jgi:hypothetical protein
MTIQRAIGLDEDFRKFLPADAASDCELMASEFSMERSKPLQIGQEKCDSCGAFTDEFGVDIKNGRILCIKPNLCFKRKFNAVAAESEV